MFILWNVVLFFFYLSFYEFFMGVSIEIVVFIYDNEVKEEVLIIGLID